MWPAGLIVVLADNGEKSNILIVGSGTSATIFYDADGTARGNLADGNARVTVGKKVEVKYVPAPANYATTALAVSVRYLAETPTASEGAPRADSAGAQTSASASVPIATGETIGGKFKIVEVKHFTQSPGLGLSPEFINYFYDGLRERLKKEQVANQIVDEGAAVPDAEAANTMIVEGKFTEYKKGGFLEGVGIVGSEIKLYRKSDHKLIATINPRVPFKPSPLNTDNGVGKMTGYRTAVEIRKALQVESVQQPSAKGEETKIFTGKVEKVIPVRGGLKIVVTDDKGTPETFFVMRDKGPIITDASGKVIAADDVKPSDIGNKKIEVKYSIITNGSFITNGKNQADSIKCLN